MLNPIVALSFTLLTGTPTNHCAQAYCLGRFTHTGGSQLEHEGAWLVEDPPSFPIVSHLMLTPVEALCLLMVRLLPFYAELV